MATHESSPCSSLNGTYACDRAVLHNGYHRRTEIVYDSRNQPMERRVHTWAHSYGPVRTRRVKL